jgi:hypothetical protein
MREFFGGLRVRDRHQRDLLFRSPHQALKFVFAFWDEKGAWPGLFTSFSP